MSSSNDSRWDFLTENDEETIYSYSSGSANEMCRVVDSIVARHVSVAINAERKKIAEDAREFVLDVPWYGSRTERMVDQGVEGLASDVYHRILQTPPRSRARRNDV